MCLLPGTAVPTAAETVDSWPGPGRAASVGIETPVQAGPDCALLDDPVALGKMSYALETKLLVMCGRIDDLAKRARPLGQPVAPLSPLLGNDVQVNNSGTDTGSQTTQSETSIAVNLNTGTICSAHNDSQHYTGSSSTGAFAGFSSSTNGGISFTDHGGFPAGGGGITFGYPSMVWRRSDGYFYYASLHREGLGMGPAKDV